MPGGGAAASGAAAPGAAAAAVAVAVAGIADILLGGRGIGVFTRFINELLKIY
jgi:hypothetical protein